MKTFRIGIAAAFVLAIAAAPAAAPVAATQPTDPDVVGNGHKVTICHATSSRNPDRAWRVITVDIASAGGLDRLRGHRRHALGEPNHRGRSDVIPAFSYAGQQYGPYGDGYQEGLPEVCQGEVYQEN